MADQVLAGRREQCHELFGVRVKALVIVVERIGWRYGVNTRGTQVDRYDLADFVVFNAIQVTR
jgi:hypothetical protein